MAEGLKKVFAAKKEQVSYHLIQVLKLINRMKRMSSQRTKNKEQRIYDTDIKGHSSLSSLLVSQLGIPLSH
jgi:hypothetical protein